MRRITGKISTGIWVSLAGCALTFSILWAAIACHWLISVRRMQQTADSYASTLITRVGHNDLPLRIRPRKDGVRVDVEHPPQNGRYRDDPGAVRVRASTMWSPPFRLPLVRQHRISGVSTAAIVRDGRPGGVWVFWVE